MQAAGKDRRAVHFVTLLRDHGETIERWVFTFQPPELQQLYEVVGRYAADPELRFTWRDAAEVMTRAMQLVRDTAP